MKKEKKQIVLNGSLLRPLSVGRGALLHAGGNIYHTSRVVAILEESEDCVRFETQNSHYHLSMSLSAGGCQSAPCEIGRMCVKGL